jgi:electron-transferring-flavoprotein dehydrogenase
VQKELRMVRNFEPIIAKFGGTLGTVLAGANLWLEYLGLRLPFTMKHRSDAEKTGRADLYQPIKYPKPDGVLSFDRLSSVALSFTNHAEDQPVHLKVADLELQRTSELAVFAGPSTRYCPAGVYEWLGVEDGQPKYQINSQNCVHCKTCDIKDPNGNITWVTPEGGGGPNYPNM